MDEFICLNSSATARISYLAQKEEVLIKIRKVSVLSDDDLKAIGDFELDRLNLIYRILLQGYSINSGVELSKYRNILDMCKLTK